jgi:hypothetical protein
LGFRNLLDQYDYFRDLNAGDKRWFPELLLRVMNGEQLRKIAEDLQCHGTVLREFIRRDDDLETEYQAVLEKKREMAGEELLDSTIAAARANVQDARNGSGTDWLEVDQWPKGLLAAADTVEFGSDGRPFKIKADVGKSKDRLARMLGLEKSEANVNLSVSLVSVLSGMPAGAIRQRPGAVEDATYSAPKQVSEKADAGEEAPAVTPAGTLLLDNPPRQAVSTAVEI